MSEQAPSTRARLSRARPAGEHVSARQPATVWRRRAVAAVVVALVLNGAGLLVRVVGIVPQPPEKAALAAGAAVALFLSLVLGVLLAIDWQLADRRLHLTEMARRRVDRLAHRDPLTELPNRRALDRELAQRCALAAATGTAFAVHLVDVDGLKAVNDRFGHAAGDRLLRDLTALLRRLVREGDLVARFGGDEFAILQEEASPERAARFAARLVERMRAEREKVGLLAPSASIGTALAPLDADAPDTILVAADRALYAAKRAGGSGWSPVPPDDPRLRLTPVIA